MKDFSELYIEYYPRLLRFACDFVACKADAENLLHDAFLDLWKINDYIPSIKHINAYMFRLVRNRCIDYLKHQMCEKAYMEEAAVECRNKMITLEGMGDEQLIAKELATLIRETVDKLPPRCREIFLMSRIEGLRHGEIAERLGLSENTVAVQMGIALRRIRAVIAPYI